MLEEFALLKVRILFENSKPSKKNIHSDSFYSKERTKGVKMEEDENVVVARQNEDLEP
jgi:hypothetical protein